MRIRNKNLVIAALREVLQAHNGRLPYAKACALVAERLGCPPDKVERVLTHENGRQLRGLEGGAYRDADPDEILLQGYVYANGTTALWVELPKPPPAYEAEA